MFYEKTVRLIENENEGLKMRDRITLVFLFGQVFVFQRGSAYLGDDAQFVFIELRQTVSTASYADFQEFWNNLFMIFFFSCDGVRTVHTQMPSHLTFHKTLRLIRNVSIGNFSRSDYYDK